MFARLSSSGVVGKAASLRGGPMREVGRTRRPPINLHDEGGARARETREASAGRAVSATGGLASRVRVEVEWAVPFVIKTLACRGSGCGRGALGQPTRPDWTSRAALESSPPCSPRVGPRGRSPPREKYLFRDDLRPGRRGRLERAAPGRACWPSRTGPATPGRCSAPSTPRRSHTRPVGRPAATRSSSISSG